MDGSGAVGTVLVSPWASGHILRDRVGVVALVGCSNLNLMGMQNWSRGISSLHIRVNSTVELCKNAELALLHF